MHAVDSVIKSSLWLKFVPRYCCASHVKYTCQHRHQLVTGALIFRNNACDAVLGVYSILSRVPNDLCMINS